MAKAKGKTANIFVWIILGLLILGLAGFGVEGFGGRVTTIGQVGERSIPAQDYFRALQRELRAFEAQTGAPLGFERARALGIDRAVLSRLVTVAALENEADRLGISVGDATLRDQLTAAPEFRGPDGRFDREAYRFLLQQEGWSERDFEERLRRDLARGILQAGILSVTPEPRPFTDAVLGWLGERRSFGVLTVGRAALTEPVPAPTEADLAEFHAAHAERFTLPEARRIAYAWLTPAMLIDTVEIDEAALREAYDRRAAEFRRPERRLVERIVFSSEAEAAAARARLDDGAAFAEIAAERGLAPEDIDMGDVTEAELGAAGPGVFALDGPGVAGPLPTPFGPALFNVIAVLAARETPFDEAIPALREELAAERARRLIADRFEDFEDMLAGGADLEELARDTEMAFGTIDLRPGDRDGIAAYQAFRQAAAVGPGDFPALRPLEDGGVFALRLLEIVPPVLQPLEDVAVQVIEAWEAAEVARRVAERAEALRPALDAGEVPEGPGLAFARFDGASRAEPPAGLPAAVTEAAFDLDAPGAVAVVAEGAQAHLVRLEEVAPPLPDDPGLAPLRDAIGREARAGLAEDLFLAWAGAIEREVGVSLNQAAIDAVHGQLR